LKIMMIHRRMKMSNSYDGNHAICKICGYFWKCTLPDAAQRCGRCEKVLDDYPELWSWILGVIKKKIDAHELGDH
jgi:hypothetical protein